MRDTTETTNAGGTPSAWTSCPRPVPGATARLVCIPYAGGGASAFAGWGAGLNGIELWLAQLPGRERRFLEAPAASMEEIVRPLAREVADRVRAPFALFGHSMGALIAFETARELRRLGGPEPAHVFVSATRPPHETWPIRAQLLTDPELAQWMARLGGVPAAVMADRELVDLIVPILRADLDVCRGYAYQHEDPLSCPVTAFAGQSDFLALPAAMAAWERHTTGAFRLVAMPGGHFFLNEHRPPLLTTVARALRLATGQPAADPAASLAATSR